MAVLLHGDRLPVGIAIVGVRLKVWLPDLGVDRDIDRGETVGTGQDADAPDMLFRRVEPYLIGFSGSLNWLLRCTVHETAKPGAPLPPAPTTPDGAA